MHILLSLLIGVATAAFIGVVIATLNAFVAPLCAAAVFPLYRRAVRRARSHEHHIMWTAGVWAAVAVACAQFGAPPAVAQWVVCAGFAIFGIGIGVIVGFRLHLELTSETQRREP